MQQKKEKWEMAKRRKLEPKSRLTGSKRGGDERDVEMVDVNLVENAGVSKKSCTGTEKVIRDVDDESLRGAGPTNRALGAQ